MHLREVMTKDVEIIHPDASVKEAAAMMRTRNIGGLPVCDGDRLVGFVTDGDITVRTTAEGRDPTNTRVRDAMTPEVVYSFEDQNVQEAARLMESKQMRRLPILSRAKRLVGIVALGDLAVDAKLGGKVLKRVSEPPNPTASATR